MTAARQSRKASRSRTSSPRLEEVSDVSISIVGQSALLNHGVAALLERHLGASGIRFQTAFVEKEESVTHTRRGTAADSASTGGGSTLTLLLVVLSHGDDVKRFRQLLRRLRPQGTKSSAYDRAVLITDAVSMDDPKPALFDACLALVGLETDIQVFLGTRDDAETLVAGVLAAIRGEAFCSPSLFPHLLRALRSASPQRISSHADGDASSQNRHPLTWREREIAMLIAREGLSNEEIAQRLNLSINTVKTHIQHVYRKLGIARRTGIAPSLDIPYAPQD